MAKKKKAEEAVEEEVIDTPPVEPTPVPTPEEPKHTDGKQCRGCALYVGDRRCSAYPIIPMEVYNGKQTHDAIRPDQRGDALFTPFADK